MMLYPANMSQHGPSRSIEEYLAWLYEQFRETEIPSARATDMLARIRAIEDEINARGDL